MRIGIFETVHFEGAYPVINLFNNGQNKITIFTYPDSFRQFEYLFKEDMSNYNWVVKNASESKLRFIYRVYKYCKKTDFHILYLNTIADNHIAYAGLICLLRKTRVIVTLHDINNHFLFRPTPGLRRWIRYIGKRSLIRVTNEFNVVSSTMVTYLKSKLPAYKKVHCIPGSVFEEEKRPIQLDIVAETLRIVVPGTVDNRRRNYNLAFNLLDEINQKNLPMSVVLLGGISEYGKEILDRCKQYVSNTANLKFFQTDIVDQPIFDREMDDAHFIFIPSLINTVISDGIGETYGLSISSGTIFDVIKHAKPFIVPDQLAIPKNLESSCFRYSIPEDIVPFLENFATKPELYNKWRDCAIENSRQYTTENIRNSNPSLFMQGMENS